MPNAKYYARHKEKSKAATQVWRDKNRDRLDAYNLDYRNRTKEEKSEYNAAYYRLNNDPEGNRTKALKWYKENKKRAVFRARARKQKLSAIDEMLPGEWEAVVSECGNRCIVPGCGASPVTQDHVTPLSKGGRHHVTNIQPLCAGCNDRKGVKVVDYRNPTNRSE